MDDYGWVIPALLGIFMTSVLVLGGRAMDSQKKEITAEIGKQIAEAKLEIIKEIMIVSAKVDQLIYERTEN